MNDTAARARDLRVALVGIGAWGRNLARNYAQMPGAELRWVCDRDPRRLADASRNFRMRCARRTMPVCWPIPNSMRW